MTAQPLHRPNGSVVGLAVAAASSGSGRLAKVWRKARPYALRVAGLGLASSAAFTVATWAGLLAAGLSCLILEAVR